MPQFRPRAVSVFSPTYGDIWRAQCPACSWTSVREGKPLPFLTREEAEHCVDLHAVLCKAADRG
jgi:hypothetical protein